MTETLDRLNMTGETEIITVDGQARAVLMSPAAYDELASEAGIQSMKRAIRQLEAGEGEDFDAAMDDVRARLLAMKNAQLSSPVK